MNRVKQIKIKHINIFCLNHIEIYRKLTILVMNHEHENRFNDGEFNIAN